MSTLGQSTRCPSSSSSSATKRPSTTSAIPRQTSSALGSDPPSRTTNNARVLSDSPWYLIESVMLVLGDKWSNNSECKLCVEVRGTDVPSSGKELSSVVRRAVERCSRETSCS